MGGGAVTSFMIRNPEIHKNVTGVILSGPFLKMDEKRNNMNRWDQWFLRKMRYHLGHIYTTPDIGPAHLFRREGAMETLMADNKMFPIQTANSAVVFFDIADTVQSYLDKKQLVFNTNLMVFYGKKDA